MTERRYGDEEVREIFGLATTGGTRERPLPAEPGGLTLDDLQRIGQEAGIEPARVAQAAERIDARGTLAPVRASSGCRSGCREWSQGDLQISVEPTEHGEQLRISTVNNVAIVLSGLGFLTGGMSLLMGAVVAAAGKPEKALVVLGLFGTMSLASFGATLIQSPRWARERERQMDMVAEQTVKLLSETQVRSVRGTLFMTTLGAAAVYGSFHAVSIGWPLRSQLADYARMLLWTVPLAAALAFGFAPTVERSTEGRTPPRFALLAVIGGVAGFAWAEAAYRFLGLRPGDPNFVLETIWLCSGLITGAVACALWGRNARRAAAAFAVVVAGVYVALTVIGNSIVFPT